MKRPVSGAACLLDEVIYCYRVKTEVSGKRNSSVPILGLVLHSDVGKLQLIDATTWKTDVKNCRSPRVRSTPVTRGQNIVLSVSLAEQQLQAF